jgi:predicted DNA-binding transcriptional regulator AlpA
MQTGFAWADRADVAPAERNRVPAALSRTAAAAVPSPPSSPALPPDNELWDVAAAAQFLKMSASWIYKRVEHGELPCVRVNGWALRFVPAQLREWAEGQGKRRSRSRRATEP